MAEATTTQKAVVATGTGEDFGSHIVIADVAAPAGSPADGFVRVKVAAAALNPVDWKMVKYNFLVAVENQVLGCDVAGTVVALGAGVDELAVGDEVFGFQSIDIANGTFQDVLDIPAYLLLKRPAHLSATEAATLPVALYTAVFGIFRDQPGAGASHAFERDAAGGAPFLVWGGSSSVGQVVIQLAAAAGFHVIAVASAKQHSYLCELGAAVTVDYHDDDVDAQIRAAA